MGEQGEFRTLREWTPMTHLLQQIPLKAQRGLFTHQLNLTCIDCLPEFLVLGTNLGLVYWYDRRKDELQRLRCESSSSPIVCVRVVSTLDFMIAAGSEDGNVTVFQIPRPPPDTVPQALKQQQNRQIERFTISGLHMSPVTALEWSPNGMKLFSGDRLGIIVLTEIDFYMHLSKSREVLNEKYEVVQLSYHCGTGIPQGKLLLVSTVYRTTVCSWRQEDRSWKVTQLGQRERKTLGQFGATFFHPSNIGVASHHDSIFASRPGLRLWQAGLDGIVQQTLIFKDALMCPHPSIMLVNPVPSRFKLPKVAVAKTKDRRMENKNAERPGSSELAFQHQLGYLNPFAGGLIVAHWKGASGSLLVLDPEDTGVITSVKTGTGGLRSIISVAVTPIAAKSVQSQSYDGDSIEQGPEIFILEGGRSLIRIAYLPDFNYSKGSGEQEEGLSSSVRSLFSTSIFPPSLPSPPPLLKDLTTSLLELTTGSGIGTFKSGERTPPKGSGASSSEPISDVSPFDKEVITKDVSRKNVCVVMADEALEIPPVVGMPFEKIPKLKTSSADEMLTASKVDTVEKSNVQEVVGDTKQPIYEEILYKPKKTKGKRKKSNTLVPNLLETGGPCSEGSSTRSTGSEEDSSHAVCSDPSQLPSTANTSINGPLHSSWPPPGKQDASTKKPTESDKSTKIVQKIPLDMKEDVTRRRKSEIVTNVNLRSSVVEEGHVGGVEAWLPSMPMAPDLRSPTSIRQDVESKGELLAKLLDLKPIVPQILPEPNVEETMNLPDELTSLHYERSFVLKDGDEHDIDPKYQPPSVVLDTSVSLGTPDKVVPGVFSRKRMSLSLESEDSDQRKLGNMFKRETVPVRCESLSSDSEWELL